ncbi:MAG: hypothetical protein DRP54_04135 [Spirochaetes bacterium]|nr:MAG: hypothetical protein DRP54_04135 [Spirochaetota bacterium]
MLLNLAPDYEEATLVERENRFTLLLKKGNSNIRAFLPNTGRLEEFMIPGRIFYITSKSGGKLNYRCISTLYQDRYILLDTHKTQKILRKLIENNIVHLRCTEKANSITGIQEEYSIEGHRIDLALEYTRKNGTVGLALIEAKSCTLCHNGTGMFPDAPSKRASEHLRLLGSLKKKEIETYIVFLIPDPSAEIFIPNIHADPVFSNELLSQDAPVPLAYRITLTSPITVDLKSTEKIKIDIEKAAENLRNSGTYIISMKNERTKILEIGSLGKIKFERGHYVYVGSALNNLERRVNRHIRKSKSKRWHIDYLVPEQLKIIKIYKIRRKDRLEEKIVDELKTISDGLVKGFGAGDSRQSSHLLYFKSPPHLNSVFIEKVLDFMTFTESPTGNRGL